VTATLSAPRLSLSPSLLRPLLALDAAACGALGLVGLIGAGALSDPLGASAALLVVGALVLLAYAVEAGLVARSPAPSGTALAGLAGVNVAFGLGCLAVAALGSLTGLGIAVALALAAVSFVVADVLVLGRRGLRAGRP
jgi:hypothetical protein